MVRLKRLVLFCSTGDVCYSEPADTIRLCFDGEEILGNRQLSPPARGQTNACSYSVNLEYRDFLRRTVTVNTDGDGPWAGQDLFLIGELAANGRTRWLPLAHDLGDPHAPRWITQFDHRQMAILTAADAQQPLHEVVVTISASLDGSEPTPVNDSIPSRSMHMSVHDDNGDSKNLLLQTEWPMRIDESAESTISGLFHCHLPAGMPTTAEQLAGVQFSIGPGCAWKPNLIQVFGVNTATCSGRLLGSAGAVDWASRLQSDRRSTADLVTIQVPATTQPVRSVSAENRRRIAWRRTRMPWTKGKIQQM